MKQSNMSILLDTSLSPLWEPIKKNKQEKCSSDSDASLKEFDPMLSRLLCIICSIVSTALDDGAKIPHVAELLFLFTDIRNRFLGQADETSMKCNTVCTRLEVICEGKFTKLQFASSQHQSSEPSSAQSNDNLEKEAKADSPFETSCSTASSSLEPSSSSSAVPMACAPSDYVISPNASFSFDGTKVTNLTEDGNWASFLLPLSHKTGIWQCRVKLLHTTASFLFVGVTKADDHAPLLNCVIGQSEDSISYNAHNGSIFMKKCSHLGLDKSTQGTTIVLEANLEKNPSTFSVSVDGKIQQKIVKELPSPLRFG
eukprot:MONOS_15070.1-p1 / transcript=MONOS_15070.1 / gene=MONOS_15070 / organism=Monocercomonoides_exilis_PA203 / gene_product=unspecified product / transcript_product=unspecified product / location=Mono_scaffold01137:15266-16582(+) / protein_length=312 / sequence_SO=supercontig / SO=protein_coding / is_pseudo=false